MKLTQLNEHYKVYKCLTLKGVYNLHSLTESSRFPHKYLCSIKFNKGVAELHGYEPTNTLETLLLDIQDYLENVEYDSEAYYPHWNYEYKYYIFTFDLLTSYGFVKNYLSEVFEYSKLSIYGGLIIQLSIDYQVKGDGVYIDLIHKGGNFTRVKAKLDFEDIENTISGLLKPLLLTESSNLLEIASTMKNKSVDAILYELKGIDVEKSKVEIKTKLQEFLNQLH